MTVHRWTVENIDGGPAGDADFWVCHECGSSGGPVWGSFLDGQYLIDTEPRWDPFLAGRPELKLSNDCYEAASIIREHVIASLREYEAEHEKREKRFLGSLIRDSITWTPSKRNVIPVYNLFRRIQIDPKALSLTDVRRELVEAGFNTMPQGGLSAAVRALGEASYEDARNGEEPEE